MTRLMLLPDKSKHWLMHHLEASMLKSQQFTVRWRLPHQL
jgi:hypothetical protein